MDSVLNQSFGIDNIEYIIVDDCSTDSTKEIIEQYAINHRNICFVSLNENTGSPGLPRNIGIELASGKYILFLDADDWLDHNGIEILYNILEESNDDYVVGKTIKVETKGQSVIGEFASVMERRSISPFDVPHFFYHMGPPSKMMKLSLLKEHNIRFPEMKFAEDKLFFYDLFFHVNSVSTTTQPIYYVNRTDENPSSLTRVTNVLDKRRADLEVINYITSIAPIKSDD
ncbi:glycosyltransferase family 2 protein [Camelliibacillus cellulosilyticus]|uniref:Glycosyltransferase family 2 protein n=1 Tax=Camelliibacillus cellulosilyticus TaxID=2174486 RepID=A0ABV9GPD6_9BACL